jgi:hypothetical protein
VGGGGKIPDWNRNSSVSRRGTTVGYENLSGSSHVQCDARFMILPT